MIRPDIDDLNREHLHRFFKVFSGLIVARYCARYNPEDKLDFKIVNQTFGSPDKYTISSFEGVPTEDLKHVVTAFKYPNLLEGSMTFFVDENKIYEVEDKQITCDLLEMGDYFQTEGDINEIIDKSFATLAGQYFYQDIYNSTFFVNQGKKYDCIHEGKKYIFESQKGQLTVTSKIKNQEILNSQGFTSKATVEDVEAMYNLAKGLRTLQSPRQTPVPKLRL